MSEREPQYLILDENEDFSMSAHVDADGQQRIAVMGYLERQKTDGTYRAPLIPELFFGADGTQLETWSQYLTAGDHIVLRRDGGNPRVPDHELNWRKVSEAPQRPTPQRTQQTTPVLNVTAMAIDTNTVILALVGGITVIGVLYFMLRHK